MRNLIRSVRAALAARRMPYRVAIDWEGARYVHRAATIADARAWASCYPIGTCAVVTRRGRIVAARIAA